MNYKMIIKGITGLIRVPKNLILRSMTEYLKPEHIWIEVTDKCNARCKFCNIWQKKPTLNPLTPQEIEKALKDPLFKNLKNINLSGGEPTLRSDFEEVILRIHKLFPKASILFATNCILAKRVINIVEFALKHGINIGVGISIDAIGEKHDELRGIKGLFKRTDLMVNELIKLRNRKNRKLNLMIGFVLTNETISSFKDVKEYAKGKNIPLSIQWYNESSYYGNLGKNLLVGDNKLPKAVKNLPPTLSNEMGIKSLKGKSIKFPCFSMYKFLLMKCNGDIVPCFDFWDFKIGNVRRQSPLEIWHSVEAKKIREKVKKCKGCLNNCAIAWSFSYSVYPILLFGLKHPLALLRALRDEKEKII